MDISFNLAYKAWVFIGLIILTGFFINWIYKSTNPEVPDWLRNCLLALRFLSFSFLLLLIFEPILGISFWEDETRKVAILIDTSSSMQLADNKIPRSKQLENVLDQTWRETLEKKFDIHYFTFSENSVSLASTLPESLVFSGDGTDINAALDGVNSALEGSAVAGILLLSDGARNMGVNPASRADQFAYPVNAVGFGDENPQKDTWIEASTTNEIAYADTKVPVEVTIRSTGYAKGTAILTLNRNGEVQAQQKIELPADLQELRTRLTIMPAELGVQKYELNLTAQKDEFTLANNRKSFYINVLKSKLNILIAAGAPSPDVSILSQQVRADANMSMETVVAVNATRLIGDALPVGRKIKDVDCIIGVDLAENPHSGLHDWVQNAVMVENIPLLHITGRISSTDAFAKIRQFLPVQSLNPLGDEKQVFAQSSAQGNLHPILNTQKDDAVYNKNAALQDLPPVFSFFSQIKPTPGTQILMRSSDESALSAKAEQKAGEPLILSSRVQQRKIVAFLGSGFWRWHLMMQRSEESRQTYRHLMLNAIRWLVSSEDNQLFAVKTNKTIYRSGESIVLTGQAYNEDYSARENLNVLVQIKHEKDVVELEMENLGRGIYKTEHRTLAGGDYTYEAIARIEGSEVGKVSGKFSVEPFKVEFQNTMADLASLRQLTQKTGGRYLSEDSLASWAEQLEAQPIQRRTRSDIQIWNSWPMLFLITLTLSLEWFIRKRKGML